MTRTRIDPDGVERPRLLRIVKEESLIIQEEATAKADGKWLESDTVREVLQ